VWRLQNSSRGTLLGCNHGATTVELALVVPIVITLLFAAIEFSRYSTQRALLESAAQQAASLAAIIPNLERDSTAEQSENFLFTEQQYLPAQNTGDQQCDQSPTSPDNPRICREEALKRVVDRLNNTLKAGGIALSNTGTASGSVLTSYAIELPPPGATIRPLEERLASTPIKISLSGSFDSLIPGIASIPLNAEVSFYREPKKGSTLPVPPACTTTCPCPSDPDNPGRFAGPNPNDPCVCAAGLIEPSCACPNPVQVYNPQTAACACLPCSGRGPKNSQPRTDDCVCVCPQGMILNESQNECTCPGGGNPPCCPAGEVLCASGECVSEAICTNSGGVIDPATCKCSCDASEGEEFCATHPANSTTPGRCFKTVNKENCEAKTDRTWQPNCTCKCNMFGTTLLNDCQCIETETNSEGFTYPVSFLCTPTAGPQAGQQGCYFKIGEGCNVSPTCQWEIPAGLDWCIDGGQQYSTYGGLICKDPTCDTSLGFAPTFNQNNCRCDCQDSNMENINDVCVPKCADGNTRNYTTGECECSPGALPCKGDPRCLKCPANQVPDQGNCQCLCTDEPCPSGQSRLPFPNCQCGCPELSCSSPKVPSPDCSICQCPASKVECEGACYDPCPSGGERNKSCICACQPCQDINQSPDILDGCQCKCNYGYEPGANPLYCWEEGCDAQTCTLNDGGYYNGPEE
jgi:hypothetical protein